MWSAVLLLTVAADPAVAPSGHIAFMREGKVWVISADGSGERALTDTLFYKTERPITWMPGGRQVLYWNHSQIGWDIWAVKVDGKEPQNLTRVKSGGCRSPAPSPDGKRIAFLRDDPPGLYLMDADGTNQRRLTDKGFRDLPPTWSPDGKQLAYTMEERGLLSLRRYNLLSERDVRIGVGSSPRWSPNGKQLLFECVRDEAATLCLISPDGADEVRLTKGPEQGLAAAWSPDGTRVAYFASREDRAELRAVTVDQKMSYLLASVEGPWESPPSWSPDGKWLTFAVGPAPKRVVYEVDDQGHSLRKLATDGACYPVWQPTPTRPQ
jgi:Tol biopolymer transport system component